MKLPNRNTKATSHRSYYNSESDESPVLLGRDSKRRKREHVEGGVVNPPQQPTGNGLPVEGRIGGVVNPPDQLPMQEPEVRMPVEGGVVNPPDQLPMQEPEVRMPVEGGVVNPPDQLPMQEPVIVAQRQRPRIVEGANSAVGVMPLQEMRNWEIQQCDIGAMNINCVHCNALLFAKESAVTCCKIRGGRIVLPALRDPPEPLRRLLQENTVIAKGFRAKIRWYNNVFAFASLGVNEVPLGPGIPTFKINGTVHHYVGGILPANAHAVPKFAQIYISDPEAQADIRQNNNHELDRGLLMELQMMLADVNPYVEYYKSAAREFVRQNGAHIQMTFKGNDGRTAVERRTRNNPTVPEIAVIIPERDLCVQVNPRDIVVTTNLDGVVHMNVMNPAYDSLHYVLMFPYGEYGWQLNITATDGSKVSTNRYYRYRLMTRQGTLNTLQRCGKLLQQYIVDMYAKIEELRLKFIRCNQAQLRAELYQGVADAIAAVEMPGEVGRRILLPSTFTGSPRHLHGLYQDAMALVREFRKPDLFITFTCNPNWTEIRDSLLEGQQPGDRPDIVARVFKLKLDELVSLLAKGVVFGKVVARVHVVEFQKRGLPHSHILLILDEASKPRVAEDYDRFVCAEIPDPILDPELHELVGTHMVHGPCGVFNAAAPCMKDGKCTKGYPHEHCELTSGAARAFPVYRRRHNDRIIDKMTHGVRVQLNNRWIVPYNPYLLLKFRAHINVEICSTVSSVKYLYKYVYKGHDRATVVLQHRQQEPGNDGQRRDVDEIQSYLDARYISASEAMYRIMEYSLHTNDPPVMRLCLHLPNQQYVVFNGENENALPEALQRNERTTLTEFFTTCADQEQREVTRNLTYADFPKLYTWNRPNKRWDRRRNNRFAIGRVITATPLDGGNGERYYLRLLLHTVRGPRSFEELRTVHDTLYGTFKEACLHLGLLQEDNEFIQCLEEACQIQTNVSSLRHLFSVILVHCRPVNPLILWNRFKDSLSEDFRHLGLNEAGAYIRALSLIDRSVNRLGASLETFGLAHLMPANENELDVNYDVACEMDDHPRDGAQNYLNIHGRLNEGQTFAFEAIMEAIDSTVHHPQHDVQRQFFIDGPGGTGKTYLYNAILATVRSRGGIALAVASSGIASQLLHGGRTVHSRFKVPILIRENSTCHIPKQGSVANLIRASQVVCWDEAPMVHRHVLECIERSFRDICGNELPFGGKVMVLGGDFRQTLPIVKKGSRAQIVAASIKRSPLWINFREFHLTQNLRLERGNDGDRQFAHWLLSIGNGTAPEFPDIGKSTIQLPDEVKLGDQTIEGLINWTYEGIAQNGHLREWMSGRSILCPKNEHVDIVNSTMLQSFSPDEDPQIYYSADSFVDVAVNIPLDYINSLAMDGLPPHKLALKRNVPLILLRNLSPSDGLTNGTRLICREFGRYTIQAEIANGTAIGHRVLLPRIDLMPSDSDFPYPFKRRQFPVRPAFAMTINKAQGQTISKVGLYLPNPVFSHGQLYVGFSRVPNLDSVRVLVTHHPNINNNLYSQNIVYKEAL